MYKIIVLGIFVVIGQEQQQRGIAKTKRNNKHSSALQVLKLIEIPIVTSCFCYFVAHRLSKVGPQQSFFVT